MGGGVVRGGGESGGRGGERGEAVGGEKEDDGGRGRGGADRFFQSKSDEWAKRV